MLHTGARTARLGPGLYLRCLYWPPAPFQNRNGNARGTAGANGQPSPPPPGICGLTQEGRAALATGARPVRPAAAVLLLLFPTPPSRHPRGTGRNNFPTSTKNTRRPLRAFFISIQAFRCRHVLSRRGPRGTTTPAATCLCVSAASICISSHLRPWTNYGSNYFLHSLLFCC